MVVIYFGPLQAGRSPGVVIGRFSFSLLHRTVTSRAGDGRQRVPCHWLILKTWPVVADRGHLTKSFEGPGNTFSSHAVFDFSLFGNLSRVAQLGSGTCFDRNEKMIHPRVVLSPVGYPRLLCTPGCTSKGLNVALVDGQSCTSATRNSALVTSPLPSHPGGGRT